MEFDVVGDPRFFARSGPYTLAQVAHAAGGIAEANGSLSFNGVAPLQSACEQQVSFLHDRRYAGVLDTTRAGAVLVPPDLAGRVPTTSVAIILKALMRGGPGSPPCSILCRKHSPEPTLSRWCLPQQ